MMIILIIKKKKKKEEEEEDDDKSCIPVYLQCFNDIIDAQDTPSRVVASGLKQANL